MSHLYFSLIFDPPVDIDKYPRHTLLKLLKLFVWNKYIYYILIIIKWHACFWADF